MSMLRFSIRDLLWLTVVAALGAGWCVDRGRLLERIDELDGFLKRGGIAVEIDPAAATSAP